MDAGVDESSVGVERDSSVVLKVGRVESLPRINKAACLRFAIARAEDDVEQSKDGSDTSEGRPLMFLDLVVDGGGGMEDVRSSRG